MSHGEAPLQVGSEAIVCGARGKVKGVCLTYPLVEIRSREQGFHKKMCALGGAAYSRFFVLSCACFCVL